MTRSRGQALAETALALPVFIVAMFAVVWALKAGVLGERVELAARYGGMVSAETNPYVQYSLYAAYEAAAGSPVGAPCATAPPALVVDGAPIAAPGQQTNAFFSATNDTSSGTSSCGTAISTAAGLTAPMVLGYTNVGVTASNDIPDFLQSILGSSTTQWSASVNELYSPTMATLFACYPELAGAFEASVAPPSPAAVPSTEPIPVPSTGALNLSSSCASQN
ncbi:MAG TPA: hypothetical protein VFB22_09915 [Candidatus Baltobacteraceae bacterium]|nr:hypothetical protein [Candidatus Baltobacteraceae bacterium]